MAFFGGTPLSTGWGADVSRRRPLAGTLSTPTTTTGRTCREYARGIGRPRLFWNDDKGNRFFATAGVTIEDREGGSPSLCRSDRHARASMPACSINASCRGQYVLTTRAAWSQKHHDHQFGDMLERDRHTTAFGEVTVRGTAGSHTWVAGAAVEADRYTATDVPQFSYAFTTPGVFVQDDVAVAPWLSLSGSARLDHHSEYGTFVSPRVSALLRSGSWNSRASFGTGFFGPSALTEETEAAGLTRLSMPQPLRRGRRHAAHHSTSRARRVRCRQR